jgi:Holliday junction resolvasome RuvABC endonuclease subunit
MGLDLALRNTGVIILSEHGSLLRHFTLEYPLSRKKGEPPISDSDRIERLINLTNEIVGIAKDYSVRYAGVEGYAYAKRYQAHQIGEIAGNVKVQLWLARRILVDTVPPKTARKHFLGYGSASKKQVEKVLRDGLGLRLDTEHEVDAYVVARYLFDEVVGREKEKARYGAKEEEGSPGERQPGLFK